MKTPLRLVRCLVWCVLLAFTARPALSAAETTSPWKLFFAFGDSYTDSGAGYVDGNGPTAIVYVARDLGIPFTHATDPDAAGKGLNFAVSGAQTGEGEGRRTKDALLGRGMQNQVRDFVARVQSGAVMFEPARTLFFIAGGLNDGRLTTETTVANLTLLVRQLHAVGARHFMIGLLPQKIPQFARVGQRLSPAIASLPEKLKAEFADANFHLSRWGEYMDAVITEPARFGITNIKDPCAGRALFDQDATPKGDPATYFFYHEGHPSTAVQRFVANELKKEILAAAPAR
jgi:phospholipase/lecithinase/hemolysin